MKSRHLWMFSAAILWLTCGAAFAAQVIQVGPGRKVLGLAAASVMAKDGDTVEVDAGVYPADVAIWQQTRLTIRAVGGRARLIAMGAAAEGKGIWVVRGGTISVEGFDFVGAKVVEKNGAGIRFEKGQLSIKNCVFTSNENGILTAGDEDAELTIENSEFGHNGAGDGYSHNLYVGQIKKLAVTGSYFHHANVGHLLKSRAAENHIFYNRLTDEVGGHASYELEFPNGGLAYVVGNIIEQGSQTQNPIMVSFGAEGYKWSKNELYLIGNTLADDLPGGGTWLKIKPAGEGAKDVANTTVSVKAANNLLVGSSSLDPGVPGDVRNNVNVDWDVFVQASRQDYRLRDPKDPPLKPVDPGTANGVTLQPKREYVHQLQSRGL
jgi:hypothetical protein